MVTSQNAHPKQTRHLEFNSTSLGLCLVSLEETLFHQLARTLVIAALLRLLVKYLCNNLISS